MNTLNNHFESSGSKNLENHASEGQCSGLRSVSLGLAVALQVERSRVRFPMLSLEFFIDNHSGRTMSLELTRPLIEMSTRNISWGVKAVGAWG